MKALSVLLLLNVTLCCNFLNAQVGIFNDTPQGALDINVYPSSRVDVSEFNITDANGEINAGLVLPTMAFVDGSNVIDPSTGNATTVPGTVIYDSATEGLRVYRAVGGTGTGDGWSDPITANFNDAVVAAEIFGMNAGIGNPAQLVFTSGTPANGETRTVRLRVTTDGSYNIATERINGIQFTGSGVTSGDPTDIVLTANGTPENNTGADIDVTFTVELGGVTDTFDVTIEYVPQAEFFVVNCRSTLSGLSTSSPADGITHNIIVRADVAGTYTFTQTQSGLTLASDPIEFTQAQVDANTNVTVTLSASGTPSTLPLTFDFAAVPGDPISNNCPLNVTN